MKKWSRFGMVAIKWYLCVNEWIHLWWIDDWSISKLHVGNQPLVCIWLLHSTLQWHHIGPNGVSNPQPHHCLFKRLFRHKSKKTSKLRVTGLCVGNSPVTVEFPAQMASNAENVSFWWRHHDEIASTKLPHSICFKPSETFALIPLFSHLSCEMILNDRVRD